MATEPDRTPVVVSDGDTTYVVSAELVDSLAKPDPPPGFYRRYAVEITQVVTLEVDIHGEEEDVRQLMVRNLLDAYKRDPNGWRRNYERMFPKLVHGSMKFGPARDVGPAVGSLPPENRTLEAGQ